MESQADPEQKTDEDNSNKEQKCTRCQENNHLDAQLKIHTGKHFECSLCGEAFLQDANLKYTKIQSGNKQFSCSTCKRSFGMLQQGIIHKCAGESSKHEPKKTCSCSKCGEMFSNRIRMRTRRNTHRENKICYPSQIKGHSGERQSISSDCKTFLWSSEVKIHRCVVKVSEPDRSKQQKPGFCCPKCGETFCNKTLLMAHKKIHRVVSTCAVCGMQFHYISQLKIHMRKHTGEKPYSCPICGKKFSQIGITKQHVLVHSKVRPFSCDACGKRFSWHFQIKRHKCFSKSFHQGKVKESEPFKKLDSDRGLKLFMNKKPKESLESEDSDSDFWKESRQRRSGVTYQRNNKDFSTVKEHSINKKTLNHPDKTSNKLKNDENVDNNFCKQLSLSNKIKEVSVSDAGSYSEKTISTSPETSTASKKSHTVHKDVRYCTRERSFSCSYCEKRFVTGGHLTRHTSVHRGEELLSCIICDRTFSSESELMTHECQQESLKSHQCQNEQLITSNRQFSCSYCDEEFVLKEQLQMHMRGHTFEKRFKCSLCSETFGRQEDLTFHFECHIRCSVCNTVFDDSDSLVQHMRSHTRQTQFRCSVCGKDFAWRRHLARHMQVHANEETDSLGDRVNPANQVFTWKQKIYNCSVCHRGFSCQKELSYHEGVHESSLIHHCQTEENKEENEQTDGDDFEEPESSRNSKQDANLQHKIKDKASESSDPDTDDSDFWKETRTHQAGNGSLGSKIFKHHKGYDSDTTAASLKSQTHDNNFWKETGKSNSDLTSVIDVMSLKKAKVDIQQFSSREDWSEPKLLHTEMRKEVKDEDLEPSQIKDEQQEAEISRFTFSPVPVKTEDDEKESQFFQLYHTWTEDNGDFVGGPEKVKNSDLDSGGVYVKNDESANSDFLETRELRTSLNSEMKFCENPFNGSNKVAESLQPDSDDSVDSDFWKSNRNPQPVLNTEDTQAPNSKARNENTGKPYRCSECGKRFAQKAHLNTHMKQHAEKRQFLCSVCGQEYLYKSQWQIHMRTHTGEKPFDCPVCGKKYAHKATMQSHMTVHAVENQYSCDVCGKRFAWYTELKYHQCVGETSHEQRCGSMS